MLFKLQKSRANIAEWSSLAARRAHNPKVVGSNPASATTKSTHFTIKWVLFIILLALFYYNNLIYGKSYGKLSIF